MKKIIQLQDIQPGTKYLIRARAKNQYDFFSEWSQTYELNVVKDDVKPSKPSKPTIQIAGPQKIVVSHDNTKQGGGNLEFDVTAYKVYTNTTLSNVGGTLIHTMSSTRPGSGLNSFATINVNAPLVSGNSQTLYFYVSAVDSTGNESDPSDATTGTPITYFDSAYISELTADRIRTGTLQANQSISVGTLAPIIIKSNENSPRGQIYIGTRNDPTGAEGSGYKDIQTAFYVDSTGKFSLKDQLYWDGTTLTIQGVLKIGEALTPGSAANDVNNNSTTIVGDKIKTGNLISNNYESNIPGQPQAQSNSFTDAGTWIDLDSGDIYSKSFYITNSGTASFKGQVFSSGLVVQTSYSSDKISYSTWSGTGMGPSTPTTYALHADSGSDFIMGNETGSLNPSKIRWIYNGQQRSSIGFEVSESEGGTQYPFTLVIRSQAVPGTPGKILISAQNNGTIELKGNVTINDAPVETPTTIRNRYKNGINEPSDGNKITFSSLGPTGTPNRGDIHLRYL